MEVIEVIDTPIEVIQITEREVEVIEMIERGPAGPAGATGPQGPAGAGGVTSVTGTAPIVSSGGTTPAISVTVGTGASTVAAGNDSRIANIAANSITTAQGANSGGAGGTITMRGGITGSNGAGGNAGSINLRGSDDRDEGAFHGGSIDLSGFSGHGGSITSTGNSEAAGGSLNMSGNSFAGGSINTSGGGSGVGGSIDTSNDGGSINTRGTGSIGLGTSGTRTTLTGTATDNRAISLPNAGGTLALTTDIPSTFAASAITSGTFDNARVNFAAPPAIGNTTRNTGAFTTLTATPTSGSALTLTGGTVTASAPVLDATQTWNASGTTFTALRLNATNTASASASLLADFQVGGTSVANIRRDGRVLATSFVLVAGASSGTGFSYQSATGDGGHIQCFNNAGSQIFTATTLIFRCSGDLSLGRAAALGQSPDTILVRDDAGVLAQRNAANAQTFRLYSTFTSTTSFERLNIAAQTGGSFIIGTEKGSAGGTARALEFQTDGVTRMTVAAAGAVSTSGNFSCVDITCSTLTVTSGSVTAAATGAIRWNGRARFNSPADSIVTIVNAANTDFNRLQFGGTSSSFPALKRDSTALQVRLADDSAFAPFACAGLTLNGDLTASTRNIVTDTTTGTKIGTGTTQLLGFWNATPAVQPAAVADATDAATVITQLNALLSRLRTIGLIAT